MRRIFLASLLLAFAASSVLAQTGYVTVTASHLTDFSGGALNNATINFVPTTNQGQLISARIGATSGGQGTTRAVSFNIAAGGFSATLADTSLTNPVNVCYNVMITDNSTGNVLLNYPCVQPASSGAAWCSGTACNFDNYIPSTPAGALASIGPQGPQGTSGTNCASGGSPGTCTFNGTLIATVKVAAPQIVSPGVSKGAVIYASGTGCALNTNIISGGGTDDTACLQTALDTLGAAGGGTLVIDGYALISATKVGSTNPVDGNVQWSALQMHSNTTIDATGGGVFLAASSNCIMLSNNVTGNPAATPQTNIGVTGGIWNGNGANQSRYEAGNTSGGWVFGMFFGGFTDLNIRHVTIKNARTFAATFANGNYLTLRDVITTWDTYTTSENHDGLHFWGTLQFVKVSNYTDINGGDDALALNTDEGVNDYVTTPSSPGIYRYPWSGGALNSFVFDTTQFINTAQGIRWYGVTVTGGVATVSDIVFRNTLGNLTYVPMINSGISASGPITIDRWSVSGYNAINVPTSSQLTLADIVSGASITIGSSSTLTPQAMSTLLSAPVTITPLAGAGTGGTAGCYAGFHCTVGSGTIILLIGTSPALGAQTQIATAGTTLPNPLNCTVSGGVYDTDSASIYPVAISNTTAHFQIYTASAPTAGYHYVYSYTCGN